MNGKKIQRILATNTTLGVMHPDGVNLAVSETGVLDVTDKIAKSDLSNVNHSDRTDLNDSSTLATSKAVNDLNALLGSNKANISGDNAPMLVNTYENQVITGFKTFTGDQNGVSLLIKPKQYVVSPNYSYAYAGLAVDAIDYNNRMAKFEICVPPKEESKTTQASIICGNHEIGWARVNACVDPDNKMYATCTETPQDATSNEIATASWVRARINENNASTAVLKPGDYFISSMGSRIGALRCNGDAVSRTTYKRLFDVIGTTFGAGDGSTTFNLPDMRGDVLQMAGKNGIVIDKHTNAGLPNITGSFVTETSGYTPVGSFYTNGLLRTGNTMTGDDEIVYFDASRSSNIYGKSSTVQPPSFGVYVYIVY